MPLTLPATVPQTRLYVVCSSVSVLPQLLRAQLNALLCLLPAKSPPRCQHPWDSTGTLAQSALSLGSHRLLSVLPIHFSRLVELQSRWSVVCCFSVCDGLFHQSVPEGEFFYFINAWRSGIDQHLWQLQTGKCYLREEFNLSFFWIKHC